MEYSIRELSQLAGVSARTLRYYDEIGLLKPCGIRESGYRIYGEKEVDLLQQILFYRERGLSLEQIKSILYQKGFDARAALTEHLIMLKQQQERTRRLIETVKKTIASMEGEYQMKDQEKFEAFKKGLVDENEKTYGEEIRQKYGEEAVDASNRKMMKMTEEEYEHFQNLEKQIREKLQAAVLNGADPEGEAGKEAANLHREWLKCTWGTYTADAHRGLAEMYLADPRFTEYYDKEVKGCAAFLNQAVKKWIPAS